ncbi:MAG: hypothetical protein GOU98_03665 [Candidatus Altiarchaeota archaeon]|nr:hypothetical protein [Candidatus Altiarchaeota archaeon]
MTLRVEFHKHDTKNYFDVSASELIFSSEFMKRLLNAIKNKKNYEASVAGIHEVHTSNGRVDHSPFFLVQLDNKTGAFEFLFKILPGESSQLIGVNPKVDTSRLKTLVETALIKKSTPVKLYI